MPKPSRTIVTALIVCLMAGAVFAQSQATTAQISGQVTDAQGGALPGVTVTVTNPATGFTRSVVTSAEGLYVVALVPPGEYDVTFELGGFASGKGRAIATVGASVTFNHQMQLGGIQETVTVLSQSSLVETRPVPKSRAQKRLTATRAVSGFSGLTSQRASARRSGRVAIRKEGLAPRSPVVSDILR